MTEHDRARLGPYVLGGLDPAEQREVAEHVAGCAECRAEVAEFEELKEFLGEVPPEAFLDGPPEGGDLFLQRTLQAVRAEPEQPPAHLTGPTSTAPGSTTTPDPTAPEPTPPTARTPDPTTFTPTPPGLPATNAGSTTPGPVSRATAPSAPSGPAVPGATAPGSTASAPTNPGAFGSVGSGGGSSAGVRGAGGSGRPEAPDVAQLHRRRSTRRSWMLAAAVLVLIAGALTGGIVIGRQTADPVVATQTPTPPPPGARETTVTDPVSQVTMATTLEPRQDWSYVHVKLTGVPAGSECELVVVDKAGKDWIAGSWIIGEKGAREGARFGGGVVVPAEQVSSVKLKTLQGKVLASTSF